MLIGKAERERTNDAFTPGDNITNFALMVRVQCNKEADRDCPELWLHHALCSLAKQI